MIPVLLLKATLLLLVALGATLVMQRASATARHLVWLVTLGTLLLVPALSAWAPLRLAVLPPAATSTFAPRSAARDAITQPASNVDADAATPATPSTPATPATPSTPATVATHASPWSSILARVADMSATSMLFTAWVVVMLAIAASLAWAGFAVRRIVRNARPLDSADWRTPLWEVADRMGLEEAPRLLQSDEARMPFACGMLAPTIVLPADCATWSLERRHAVLLHELAHVRRRDLLGHTLGRIVCAVYWFHPLVWTAAKRLRAESERACDDLALACGTRAADYAEHLLDIVTSVRQDATPSVALAMARRKEFEGRMLAILDPELHRAGPSRLQSIGLIASLALIAMVVGAAAPAPRVANTGAVQTAQVPAETLRTKSYPDSGVRGEMRTRTETRESTRMDVRQETRVSSVAPVAAASATASAAATTAAPAHGFTSVRELRAFIHDEERAAAKDSDDRPVLLARVLRTDTSASLRRVAAWGLREFAEAPVAVQALSNALLHDRDVSVREMSAWALGEGSEGDPVVADALSNALRRDADERVRSTAAWAIGHTGNHASMDVLLAALNDASDRVRQRALWAIGNVEPKQAPQPVIALLRDKDARVRDLAAWVLFRIEDPAAIPALESALKVEQDKEVQLAFIRALGAMGEKSVDALRGLLESPDPRVKSMAVRALAGGHASGPWPWPWPEPRPYP